jgi:hypothetical protein
MPTQRRHAKEKGKKYRKTRKQMGREILNTIFPPHPLAPFIKKKVDDKYFLIISKKNNHHLNLDNIYIKCFLEKMLSILRVSFEREKQYHINQGSYPPEYNHQISTILSFLNNPNYITGIATDENLIPQSYLHIERKHNDYDKMWTVCTNPESRGKGFSSFVITNSLKEQKAKKRKRMLLEVYNDDVINRRENDTKQNQIMDHFKKHGFNEVHRQQLSPTIQSQLLSDRDETKVMIMDF